MHLTLALILAATASNGILAGASLDQSIKQLPARHKIGVLNYSTYSRAADLGNGILWYGILGIGAALLTIAAGVATYFDRPSTSHPLPVYISVGLTILHSFATMQAAPTNFSQHKVANDERALNRVFDKFAKLQTIRCTLQVITFGVMLWALVANARS
jgi:hypothetical protein